MPAHVDRPTPRINAVCVSHCWVKHGLCPARSRCNVSLSQQRGEKSQTEKLCHTQWSWNLYNSCSSWFLYVVNRCLHFHCLIVELLCISSLFFCFLLQFSSSKNKSHVIISSCSDQVLASSDEHLSPLMAIQKQPCIIHNGIWVLLQRKYSLWKIIKMLCFVT